METAFALSQKLPLQSTFSPLSGVQSLTIKENKCLSWIGWFTNARQLCFKLYCTKVFQLSKLHCLLAILDMLHDQKSVYWWVCKHWTMKGPGSDHSPKMPRLSFLLFCFINPSQDGLISSKSSLYVKKKYCYSNQSVYVLGGEEFLIPLVATSPPHPEIEKQLHNVTLPSPCFTVSVEFLSGVLYYLYPRFNRTNPFQNIYLLYRILCFYTSLLKHFGLERIESQTMVLTKASEACVSLDVLEKKILSRGWVVDVLLEYLCTPGKVSHLLYVLSLCKWWFSVWFSGVPKL